MCHLLFLVSKKQKFYIIQLSLFKEESLSEDEEELLLLLLLLQKNKDGLAKEDIAVLFPYDLKWLSCRLKYEKNIIKINFKRDFTAMRTFSSLFTLQCL